MNQKQVERAAWVRDDMDVRAAEQDRRITPLEAAAKAIFSLQRQVTEQGRRIKCLEQETALSKEQRLQVIANAAVITRQSKRIEKLEAALRDTVHCLIGGSVDVNAALPGSDTLYEHHILGVGSVMTMAEIYRRFKE